MLSSRVPFAKTDAIEAKKSVRTNEVSRLNKPAFYITSVEPVSAKLRDFRKRIFEKQELAIDVATKKQFVRSADKQQSLALYFLSFRSTN